MLKALNLFHAGVLEGSTIPRYIHEDSKVDIASLKSFTMPQGVIRRDHQVVQSGGYYLRSLSILYKTALGGQLKPESDP